jgi:hypothetical protein
MKKVCSTAGANKTAHSYSIKFVCAIALLEMANSTVYRFDCERFATYGYL